MFPDPHVHGADRYFPKHFLQHVLALHEDLHRIDRRYPDFGVIELYVFLYLLERAQLARLVQRLLDQLLKNFEVRRQILGLDLGGDRFPLLVQLELLVDGLLEHGHLVQNVDQRVPDLGRLRGDVVVLQLVGLLYGVQLHQNVRQRFALDGRRDRVQREIERHTMSVVARRHFNDDVQRLGHQHVVGLLLRGCFLIRCLFRCRFDRGHLRGFQHIQVHEHSPGGGGQLVRIELDAHVQVLRPDVVFRRHIQHESPAGVRERLDGRRPRHHRRDHVQRDHVQRELHNS